jgi:pleiotropic regulator 1
MRTKGQIHILCGHENTVGSILTNGVDPQVITGSYDNTVKLWDLAKGGNLATLTQHKKSVRSLVASRKVVKINYDNFCEIKGSN